MTKPQHALESRDVAQIAVGSLLLAFPVATTEEVWNLSVELAPLRVAAIALLSLVVVGLFVALVYRRTDGHPSHREFYRRVTAVYVVTIAVCAAILLLLDRLPLATALGVAIKRTVLVAFPASFSATVVDSLS